MAQAAMPARLRAEGNPETSSGPWPGAPFALALAAPTAVSVWLAFGEAGGGRGPALALLVALPLALVAAWACVGAWLARRDAARGLEAALEDRSALLREINHRVGNSLQLVASLVRLQAATSDPGSWAALQRVLTRVTAVGEVHKRLQENGAIETVDIADYLASLGAALEQQLVPEGGRLSVRAVPGAFPVEPAARVGLVVGELVANATEHAYAPGEAVEVSVALDRHGDGWRLAVRDGGRGLPEGMVPAWQGSLGMTLLHSLAAELGGTLRFQTNPGRGTVACLEFPHPRAWG